MQYGPRGMLYAPQNPIARVLAVIAGLGIMALVFFLGVIFFAAFAALGAIAWVVLSVRRWWLTRDDPRDRSDPDIVDVEYRVVRGRDEQRRR